MLKILSLNFLVCHGRNDVQLIISAVTVNPLINAPFFLTPPSIKRLPKNQNYFINASLF